MAHRARLSALGAHRFDNFWLVFACLAMTACAQVLGARAVTRDARVATTFHQIAVGSEKRGFLLHRPPEVGGRALPVFIVLHGSSANANTGMEESGMNAIADSVGALAVYPNGTSGIPYFRLFWNYPGCCGGKHAGPDEHAMVRAIVDTLAHHFAIDRTRIGLIGFSDAGTLAYELACDDSETLTAIGVISGEVPESSCRPNLPVSTVVFHGTADGNIRYGQTAERVADWAARQRCGSAHVDTVRSIARSDYTHCASGDAEVTLYTIIGGRHAWPGGSPSWFLAPAPTREIDASRVFATFVVNHPRRIVP